MGNLKLWAASVSVLVSLAASAVVHAEPYGLLNGRSANISAAPATSVEFGAVFGDLELLGGDFNELDYEHFGGRYNYKFNPTTVIHADVGSTEVGGGGGADGITFGLGAFWQMDGIFADADFAIHASFHRVALEDNDDDEVEGNSIVVEGVFSSSEPINQAGTMYLYGNVGLNRIDLKEKNNNRFDREDSFKETELMFGGGVVLRTQSGSGEIFGGLLYLGDLAFGAGYRHFLK